MKSNPQRWAAEYGQGGLPSSHRHTPSGAVVWAWEKIGTQQAAMKQAVDIGCGKGRNSLFLARQGMHVTAMDFTPNAIAALQHAAEVEGLSPRIRALVYDVTEGWPVAEHSIDFAIDTFCFKHIVGNDARDSYRDNLIRALAVRGWYLISFASIGDGYYGQYLPDASAPEGVIVDPANGIESVLYTRDRVVQYFHNAFDLVAERIKDGPDVQHGKMYNRQTYALLFRHRVNERP